MRSSEDNELQFTNNFSRRFSVIILKKPAKRPFAAAMGSIALCVLAFAAILSLLPGYSEAQVCMNCSPATMTINEGDAVTLPVMITGGSHTGEPVEFFVWKTDSAGQKSYMDADGSWNNFSTFVDIAPLGELSEMVGGADIPDLTFIQDTTGMKSFTLYVCCDDNVDGKLPDGDTSAGAHCGHVAVNITPKQTCTSNCGGDNGGGGRDPFDPFGGGGGSCTPSSVKTPFTQPVFTVATGGSPSPSSIDVTTTDNCDNPITVTASNVPSWLTATPSAGTLKLTPVQSQLPADSTSATITLSSSGLSSASLLVTLTVTGPCTPSSVSLSDSSISKSVSIGGSISDQTITVRDNCGNNLDYTVSSVTGSWLSTVPAQGSSGNGSLTAKFSTSSLAAGTYSGSIVLNFTGYSSKTIPVSVSVTSSSSTSTLANNGQWFNYYYIDPGQSQYYYFNASGSSDLFIQLINADTQHNYNVDMLVKYSGAACDDSKKPTVTDWQNVKNGTVSYGQNGLYFNITSYSNEVVEMPNYQPGCYYVMLYYPSVGNPKELYNFAVSW